MFSQLLPALRMLVVLTVLTGVVYPLLVTGVAQARVSASGERQPDRRRRQDRRIGIDRSAIRRSQVLLEPAVGDFTATVQRRGVFGFESGGAQSGAGGRSEGSHQGVARRRSRQRCARAGGSGHGVGKRTRPAHQRCGRQLSGAARGQGARHRADAQVQALIGQNTEGRTLGVLGEPRVNVLGLNSGARSDALAARDSPDCAVSGARRRG